MNKRSLGKGGFEIGEIGIGCWQFGGDFGPMEESTALSILETAVENGTDFFDTADVYGAGRSEELIGKFLKTHGANITVATKYGRASSVYPDRYTAETLRRSVEDSARRLGRDRLDLLQLHCVPMAVLRQGEIFGWLRDLKDEGLIRHFGASVESVEEGLLCMEQEGLLSLQVIFNPFRQKLVTELFPQALAKGVGIIVRLPLASGLLTGKFDETTTFVETDHRNYNRDGQFFNVGETFAGLPFETGVQLANGLKSTVPAGLTMAGMTLGWILDHAAVSTIIPGASSPSQAAANAAASEIPRLSDDLHATLARFYQNKVHQHIRGPY